MTYEEQALFWAAFGAIGTVVGSVATTAAVIVALWQTKYSTKKRLKIEFNDDIKLYNEHLGKIVGEYIGISIINIGNRDVIITDWSILTNNKSRTKIMTERQGILKVSLPAKVEIENKLDLNYEREYFNNFIKDITQKHPKLKKQKIKFQVMDSTGKKYRINSKKTYEEYCREASLKI